MYSYLTIKQLLKIKLAYLNGGHLNKTIRNHVQNFSMSHFHKFSLRSFYFL